MNLDFHYYATFLAAKIAGFTTNESQVLAHAAQYVDDSNASMVEPELRDLLRETPQPTVMAFTEFSQCNINAITKWTPLQMTQMQKIWMSFHLLPGNLKGEIQFQGITPYTATLPPYLPWELDDKQKSLFRLMCLNNSSSIKYMVNHTKNYFQTKKDLHLVGLRMHVLADSWAHTFFIGRPAWYVNEIDSSIEEFDEGRWCPLNITQFDRLYSFEDNPLQRQYALFSPMRDYNGIVYLAHARMGHLPDYPYMHLRYHPQWLSRNQGNGMEITRDNPKDFLLAFKQMVYALKCIRNNEEFKTRTYDDLENIGGDAKIETVLMQRKTDQSEDWNNLIEHIYSLKLTPYKKDTWRDAFRISSEKKKTHYYHFNKAAIMHRNCIEHFLNAAGLSLTETSQSSIL